MKKYASLIAFLVITIAAGSSGSIFQTGDWYAGLAKPVWTPPDWLFPIAWFILYFMIAMAGWLAWRTQGFGISLKFWIAQLIFNAAWSYIMFGAHQLGWALADLAAMWLMIAGFIITVWNSSRAAGLLFVPYLAWASFAGVLNLAIWQMNPAG